MRPTPKTHVFPVPASGRSGGLFAWEPPPDHTVDGLSLFIADAKEQELFDLDRHLLETLLVDRSSPSPSRKGHYRNIRWCTDEYERLGKGFAPGDPIRTDLVTGRFRSVIRPRVAKPVNEQRKRSRDSGEVFTPSRICNVQNNLVDSAWFGRNKVFNTETKNGWRPTRKHVTFPAGRTWQDYVLAPRLEISCGEAPYLASRYDPVTGASIPVERRIGLLDRKLRVVAENVQARSEWRVWALRAVRSVYGFDSQGDNVLLARENLLYTVLEAYHVIFGKPGWPLPELRALAHSISWNIWQMDGLTGCVPIAPLPLARPEPELAFPRDLVLESPSSPRRDVRLPCRIRNWSLGESSTPVAFNILFSHDDGA